jgi:hypothetical protein
MHDENDIQQGQGTKDDDRQVSTKEKSWYGGRVSPGKAIPLL